MIDWKTMKDLHVIQKLENIIGKWFGVDLIFVDNNGRIQSDVMQKDHKFFSQFFKVQMQSTHGHHSLTQEVEKWIESQSDLSGNAFEYQSFFKNLYWFCSEVVVDGECLGMVMTYPHAYDTWTATESDEMVKQLVSDCGIPESDAVEACDKLAKLFPRERSYLQELVSLVSQEVGSFHEEISKREERISELNSEVSNKYRYHNMIGKSKTMQKVYHLLEKISKSESTVLIQGSNGTGKELVAKAIHYNSNRSDAVFLAQNCSAFNDNLLDSELFGHVRGAFTGAVKDKKGLFEGANGGTLFLDEIGDTSLAMQVKLLRVLQEGTFLPVGASSPRKVNVRIIAATNKPLKEMIAKGEFREDLFYRLNVINVDLPMLKERADDIPILVEHFLEKRCAEAGVPTKSFSKKTLEKLMSYNWPGNVRQLENEVEKLVVLAGEDKIITPEYLSGGILDFGGSGKPAHLRGLNTNGSLKEALQELECLMIREGLKRCNFNKSKLAKELGISRAGLIMKVDKYDLDKRKKAAGE
jgi:two-component system, NtrC family, response regulator HupR/HoxA